MSTSGMPVVSLASSNVAARRSAESCATPSGCVRTQPPTVHTQRPSRCLCVRTPTANVRTQNIYDRLGQTMFQRAPTPPKLCQCGSGHIDSGGHPVLDRCTVRCQASLLVLLTPAKPTSL